MAANFSCGVSPVTNVGPVCGGHGSCVYDPIEGRGRCVCDAGWFGESDFQVTNSALDCQINDVVVRVLWGFFLLYHIVVFVKYLPKVRLLWEKHSTLVQKHRSVGKVYRIWHNKGLFAFLPYIFVGWGCQTVYAITKIIDQGYKLGDSIFITILYIFWRVTFYFACDTFQPSLLSSLLRSQKNLDSVIALNNYLSVIHMLVTVLISIATITPIAIPQQEFDPTVGMTSVAIFFCWTALAMLFFGLQALYIEKKVIAILNESYAISKDDRTRRIKDKIDKHQKNNIRQGFIQFCIYGIFGAFPYLWNKHDYLVPFSWVAVAVTIRSGLESIAQEESEKSGSSRPNSPPQNERKMLNSDPTSFEEENPKSMRIHGLDLDPLASMTQSQVSSEGVNDTQTAKVTDSTAVTVRISPAMRLIRALTPSRRQASSAGKQFDFQEEEGIGEDV